MVLLYEFGVCCLFCVICVYFIWNSVIVGELLLCLLLYYWFWYVLILFVGIDMVFVGLDVLLMFVVCVMICMLMGEWDVWGSDGVVC